MEFEPEVLDDVRKRLARVQGQIAGVVRMLDEGRECRDVVHQLSAASRALDRAGFRLLAGGMRYCVTNPDEAMDEGYGPGELERLFLSLS